MKHLSRRIVIAICAMSSLVGLSLAQAAETIKIGSFLAVTGPASFLGDPEKKTLELYADMLNEQGGINGKKVELILYDYRVECKEGGDFCQAPGERRQGRPHTRWYHHR